MADTLILLDTSILIEYYRKTDKERSVWFKLIRGENSFAVSAMTKYEIFAGATSTQLTFWNVVMEAMIVLPLDENAIDAAVMINASLKRKRKQIGMADLFIAATAVSRELPLATLNRKHFERIDALQLID